MELSNESQNSSVNDSAREAILHHMKVLALIKWPSSKLKVTLTILYLNILMMDVAMVAGEIMEKKAKKRKIRMIWNEN